MTQLKQVYRAEVIVANVMPSWDLPAKPYDPQSVMILPLGEGFTLDGRGFRLNSELSEGDQAFIRRLYPRAREPL